MADQDGSGDTEVEEDSFLELEIVFDTLILVEAEYDVKGDAEFVSEVELDTMDVSEFDEIHDTVFRDDADGICVIELIGVSDTVNDTLWEDEIDTIEETV